MSVQGSLFDTTVPEFETQWRWAGRDGGRLHLVQTVLDDDGEVCCCIENGRYVTVCDRGPLESSTLTYPARYIDVCSLCWAWLADEMLGDVTIEEEAHR